MLQSRGEFEFYDASRAVEYIAMPSRISNLEQDVKEILSLLKNRESNSQDEPKESETD
jgi:hypothetical protein